MIYLSTFDDNGVPSITSQVEIVPEILDELHASLPERSQNKQVNPGWIRDSVIETVAPCQISVTFISEGAGYKNALSYVVFDTHTPPKTWKDAQPYNVIFPNASFPQRGGNLTTGTTVDTSHLKLSQHKITGTLLLQMIPILHFQRANLSSSFYIPTCGTGHTSEMTPGEDILVQVS